MTHRFFKSVLCSLTIMLLCACPKAPHPQNETENPPTPPTKVLDYLSLSVQYMLNQQKPDGFFNYEYNFITGNYTNWDNVIHQTRAGYVLAKYYSFLIRNNIDPAMAPVVRESVAKSLNGYVAASLSHQNMPGQLISFYYNKGGSIMLPPVRSEAASEEQKKQRLNAEVAATAFALLTEITYWEATSDATFAPEREKWRDAVAFHLKERLKHPSEKDFFQPEAWLALAVYNVLFPNDKEINDLLLKTDEAYTGRYRPIRDIRDYSWDMAAAYIRYQKTKNSYLINFAVKQTSLLLDDIYTQHDTTANSCSMAYGLADASLILAKEPSFSRLEKTALGRSQLEYYSSLKYMILPEQTWVSLGPGRTLHSQDFKKFAGAYIYGQHSPRTSMELSEMCILTGMRFSNEDIQELKQP